MRLVLLAVVVVGCGPDDRRAEFPGIDASLVDADRFPDARVQGLHLGTVSAVEYLDQGGALTSRRAVMTAYENARLHRREEGPCRFEFIESYGMSARANAGQLVLTGGTQAPITMPVVGGGGYAAVASSGFRYSFGDAVTVTAAGGLAPAFMAATTFPASVTVTNPAPDGGTVVEVDRDGMQVTWAPTTGTGTGTGTSSSCASIRK